MLFIRMKAKMMLFMMDFVIVICVKRQILVFLPKIAGVDVGELKGVSELRVRNKVLGLPALEGPVPHVEGVAHDLQWQEGASFSCIRGCSKMTSSIFGGIVTPPLSPPFVRVTPDCTGIATKQRMLGSWP